MERREPRRILRWRKADEAFGWHGGVENMAISFGIEPDSGIKRKSGRQTSLSPLAFNLCAFSF